MPAHLAGSNRRTHGFDVQRLERSELTYDSNRRLCELAPHLPTIRLAEEEETESISRKISLIKSRV
jgi:hypothetical protein